MRTTAHGRRLPRRPRPIAVNTLALAMNGASKIDKRDADELLATVQASFKAMREGVAELRDWSILAGTLDVSLAIERQGVVHGLHEHLATAETALQSVYRRARSADGWTATPLYFHELDALREFVDLHAFQMRNLSRSEFEQVIQTATSQIRSNGGKASVVRAVSGVAA